MFARIWCYFNRHRPTRNRVRHERRRYIGICRHCSQPIERLKHHKWVLRRDV